MSFNEFLENKKIIFLDGAMGTMLQKSGLKPGEIPELYSVTHPEIITEIHRQYVEAGADIIYTNTFGANSYKLHDCSSSVYQIVTASIENARRACEGTGTLVALDVGPIGRLAEPAGSMRFEEAYEMFAEIVAAAQDCDLIVFETMTDLYELKAAVLAAKENTDKPILCTMTFEANGRTFTGCSPAAMATTLTALGVDAVGVNCSLGPKEMRPILEQTAAFTNLPLVIKPNAGLPDPLTGAYNVDADSFAESIEALLPLGIKFAGGCCGTTPEYIRALHRRISSAEYTPGKSEIPSCICSASCAVTLDRPHIIGERINPTGKKLFKQALIDRNIDYILRQAIEQTEAGAEILDVNVGLPEIDEAEMMETVVKAVQSVTDAPLQIDSSDPKAVEKGLRVYNGRAIVNSVNGEAEVLATVLPIVKKYGAAVVGLTLDKQGIPKTSDARFEIAKKIVNTAKTYGIRSEDVYIDCLTLTASAEQDGAQQTLKAVRRVRNELGCHTVLGVSNISFGLPRREIVNAAFLTMALENGLDLPIMNPNIREMRGAFSAFCVLKGYDSNASAFIEAFASAAPSRSEAQLQPAESEAGLTHAVEKGLKAQAAKIAEQLLEERDPMEVINGYLIPALDRAGDDFEKGITFLPQLIQSAAAAQACFEIIKQKINSSGKAQVNGGKIILATVKGDIHDIGKNIVKVLLENYGFNVFDLGKDVDPAAVVECAVKNDVKLIGLSALMTTTLKSMEETIALVRSTPELQNPDGSSKCLFFVGGAVLTEDYAMKIGADYYCRDAKASVDVAKRVLG